MNHQWKKSLIEEEKKPLSDSGDRAPEHDLVSVLDTDHVASAEAHRKYAKANNLGSGASEDKIEKRHAEHNQDNTGDASRMPPEGYDRPDLDKHKQSDSGRTHKTPSNLTDKTTSKTTRKDAVKYR
jgi:hypothetical protein